MIYISVIEDLISAFDCDRILTAVFTDVYVRLDQVTQRKSCLNSIESWLNIGFRLIRRILRGGFTLRQG